MTAVAVAALAVMATAVPGPASADPAAKTCTSTSVPVALNPGEPATYQVAGTLCLPPGPTPSSVQLLLPGGTYNRTYWDWPQQPNSYVDAAAQAGHATLNLDRIGTGASSHPPAALLNIYNDAYVVHQVIQAIKAKGIGGPAFPRVVLVGHSLGSSVTWAEASRFHDVDGVIVTGMAHPLLPVSGISAPFYAGLTEPAVLEPRLHVADPGYLTTWPGTRGSPLLYPAPNTDRGAVATDEKTKDAMATGELATFPLPIVDGTAQKITVPTLVAAGGKDTIFCGAVGGINCSSSASLLHNEQPRYSAAARLQAYVLPGAGHDMNLHANAQDWFAAANQWADREIGN